MNKQLWKDITYYVGGLAVIFSGLLFMVLGDLIIKASSTLLLLLILFALGSTVCWFVSGMFKEQPLKCNVFKGIAVALAIVFVFLLVYYLMMAVFVPVKQAAGFLEAFGLTRASKPSEKSTYTMVVVVSIVICAVGIVAQGANLVLTNIFKEE